MMNRKKSSEMIKDSKNIGWALLIIFGSFILTEITGNTVLRDYMQWIVAPVSTGLIIYGMQRIDHLRDSNSNK